MERDSYFTIAEPAESLYKVKSSKFLSFAYPIEREEEVAPLLEVLHKRFYDARHHCYAWRLGAAGDRTRANDDGEPSSTAGKPILGQMLSREVTNCLIVVVRYFGGTKLGVSGLIDAYKTATAEVLDAAEIVERTVDVEVSVSFSYVVMNGVMKVIKDLQPKIVSQEFDNLCRMNLTIRESESAQLIGRLEDVDGAAVEVVAQDDEQI
ncbi:MAG: YigZ family protein [Rikenellaceae bacterium]